MATLVRAGGLRGFSAVIEQLGLDVQSLASRYCVPIKVEDDEQLVSMDAYAELLEECALLSDRLDLGLLIAAGQDIGILGPLSIAMQNSTTVREALDVCCRFLHMQSHALALELCGQKTWGPDHVELRLEISLPGKPHMPVVYEQSLGDLHKITSFLAGKDYPLLQVNLPHALRVSIPEYQRFFGDVSIAGDQEFGGLVIRKSMLEKPLGAINESIRQMSMNYLRMAYDSPSRTVSDQVRYILRRALGTTQGKKSAVAALLHLHPRTLHRRLQAEGLNFEAIRREEQEQLVLRYLRQTGMPLAQVASLVGFSEQSALTRACRAWFGQTPTAIRRLAKQTGA